MKVLVVVIMISTVLIAFAHLQQESGDYPHGTMDIECSLCHNSQTWEVTPDSIRFNHETTGFYLRGQHNQAGCRDCHSSLIFAHTGISCIDCHEDVHKSELGFQCQECHTPASWNNVQEIFETHSETRFPLVGVHAIVDCESCHSVSDPYEYKTTPLTCDQCHHQIYLSSENPNHIEAQFVTDCETCHSLAASSWYQTNYLHPQSFILKEAHLSVDCNGCHQAGYAGTPNTCADCHMEDYLAAQDPDHAKFGFPTTCETCHNESHWQDAVFNHLEESGFELRGAHLTIKCTDCHVNNQISGLPRDCFGCHEDDYNGVEDPNHVSNQFSHDCLQCHGEIHWSPSTFDHNLTQFPLSGAHRSVACADCHIDGQYTGIPTDCWSCHENDYLSVTDPNHVQGQYSHDCRQCHSDVAWSPATFDHNGTNFPLTGAHLTTSCTDCHKNGQYTGLPAACISCHEDEYNTTTDPNHTAAGFPLTCENCHNTINWDQTTWDHDTQYFPVYSGAHRDKWNTCAECHVVPSDYKQFECIFCHEHNKTDMDDKHKEQNDYLYLSTACYDCHPDGGSDGD